MSFAIYNVNLNRSSANAISLRGTNIDPNLADVNNKQVLIWDQMSRHD